MNEMSESWERNSYYKKNLKRDKYWIKNDLKLINKKTKRNI